MSQNPSQDDALTETDDLTRIGGIGSKIAERLNAAGIWSLTELASRSADDIAKLLPDVTGLSAAKIDGWRDQASQLTAEAPADSAAAVAPEKAAPGSAVPETSASMPQIPAGAPRDGQHYESFLIRVLLNADGSIRRTTAQHVRTGEERHWPGLQREALPEFIETAISTSALPATVEQHQAHQVEVTSETASLEVPLGSGESRPVTMSAVPVQIRRQEPVSSAVLSIKRTVLRAAEPFTMTMTVNMAETSHADRFAYSAVIVARPMAGGPKQTVAQADGLLATTSSAIRIDAAGLPPGAYRLDGAVSLREPGSDHPVDLAALAEGLLVQVLP